MIKFRIIKKSKKSGVRVGLLETERGVVETPCLVPVATQAVVKTLTSEEAKAAKCQILIANTLHLHLRPGEQVVKKAGGLHNFMNWQGPLMTDSGGFQVFSLGFGKDYNTGKIAKPKNPRRTVLRQTDNIKEGQQPKFLKIRDKGVYFRSFIDGKKLFLGPKESMKIQEQLGADIVFAFDECTSPIASYEYTKKSLERTHNWAKICLKAKKGKQALFSVVQGGRFKDLRQKSAKFLGSLPFDGFGIGGEFGKDKKQMAKMLNWVINELPEKKPRHLLGIGYPEDIPEIIKSGVDLFDCNVPTHYARRGVAFTFEGKLDFRKSKHLKNKNPIDKKCLCFVCQSYKRNYICHLLRANEITGLKLLTFHNLYFFNTLVENIRQKIKNGKL